MSKNLTFSYSALTKNNDNNKMQIKPFINKEELEQKDTAKYLGIYFDNNLTWNKHIEYINCKLNRGIGVLRKIKKIRQEKTLENIFNAFLKLYLEYGTLYLMLF